MIVQTMFAAATLVTSITGFIAMLRKQNSTHDLVNANHNDEVNRATQLTAALTDAGINVPPQPHKGKVDE
jgi:hypothetical protein